MSASLLGALHKVKFLLKIVQFLSKSVELLSLCERHFQQKAKKKKKKVFPASIIK